METSFGSGAFFLDHHAGRERWASNCVGSASNSIQMITDNLSDNLSDMRPGDSASFCDIRCEQIFFFLNPGRKPFSCFVRQSLVTKIKGDDDAEETEKSLLVSEGQ